MRDALININGSFYGPDEAKISVFDRSYLFGDSLYEVIRTYRGLPFGLKEHLARLQASAERCRMKLSQSLETYEREMRRTLKEHQRRLNRPDADLYCRIIVSRGAGKIGLGIKHLDAPTDFTVITLPIEGFLGFDAEKGQKLKIVERYRNHPRALDPAMKSGNYLNSLLACIEAQEEGFEDALLCDQEGHLTEGSTFNLFYARNGIVATPPLPVGILDGVTRRMLMEICKRDGIEVRECLFTPDRLYQADEAFVSSSLKEALAVTRVDDVTIGDGKPGPLTRRLAKRFREEALRRLDR